jgi:predicted MFS family arabinose efflux permease
MSTTPGQLTRPLLLLVAGSAGLCAGSNYLHQPLIASIADAYGVSGSVAAGTVALAQVAYVLGLLLVAPAGDVLERRRLIVTLMLLTAAGLTVSGFAPVLSVFFIGVCAPVSARSPRKYSSPWSRPWPSQGTEPRASGW